MSGKDIFDSPINFLNSVAKGRLLQDLSEFAVEEANKFLADVKEGERLSDAVVVLKKGDPSGTVRFLIRDKRSLFGAPPVFYRVEIIIQDKLTISADGAPEIHVEDIPTFMLDLSIKKEGVFSASIGYGFDKGPPEYIVGHGRLKIEGGFSFDVFLGGLSKRGFAIRIEHGIPVAIPIGGTPFGIKSSSGTMAFNFMPRLNPSGNEPKSPTVIDYIGWARRVASHELDAWLPADDKHRGMLVGGLGCKIETLFDNGKLLWFDVGFTCLSYGPVIIYGGRGVLLNSKAISVNSTAGIDFSELSYGKNVSINMELPAEGQRGKILRMSGSTELYVPLKYPARWYMHFGTDKQPIQGNIFDGTIRASVYFMVNSYRIKTGASARLEGKEKFGPFEIQVWIGGSVDHILGWNPIQVSGSIMLEGGWRACIRKLGCVGFSLRAKIALTIADPMKFIVNVRICLELPWPFKDICYEGELKAVSKVELRDPRLISPLSVGKSTAANHPEGEIRGVIAAIHHVSGRQWNLNGPSKKAIWPDSELVVPFSKRVSDRTGKVLGSAIPVYEEGGFTVSHELDKLEFWRILPDKEERVPDVRGVWVNAQNGEMSRLHIPGEDPFAWLFPHPIQEPVVTEPAHTPIEVNFGIGKGVAPLPLPHRQELLIIETPPGRAVRLMDARPWLTYRVIAATHVNFTFNIPVTKVTFVTLAGGTLPPLDVPADFSITGTRVIREVWSGLKLIAFDVVKAVGETTYKQINLVSRRESRDEWPTELFIYRMLLTQEQGRKVDWKGRILFLPGEYRLDISGHSYAHGHDTNKQIQWSDSKKFTVSYPEALRPYVKYSTLGDSRLFGGETSNWNPTTYGLGFPVYQDYLGIISLKVWYLSRIFSKLVFHLKDDHARKVDSTGKGGSIFRVGAVSPTKNPLGEQSVLESSKKWRQQNGGSVSDDQELILRPPWPTGIASLELRFENDPLNPGKTVRLDEWGFVGSRFKNFTEHAKPRLGPTLQYYTQDGPKEANSSVTKLPQPTLGGYKGTPKSWRLPRSLAKLVVPVSGESSAAYLRFAWRARVRFGTARVDPQHGCLTSVSETVLQALVDRRERPYCLWLRTPEPLDWRRVKGLLVVKSGQSSSSSPLMFALRFLPSPDATSAFLVAYLNGIAVRIPGGQCKLKMEFAGARKGLPTLRNQSQRNKASTEKLEIPFVLSIGESWPENE